MENQLKKKIAVEAAQSSSADCSDDWLDVKVSGGWS